VVCSDRSQIITNVQRSHRLAFARLRSELLEVAVTFPWDHAVRHDPHAQHMQDTRASPRWREELERDPVGVAKREAGAVVRIDDTAVCDSQVVQALDPGLQPGAVGAPEGDMI
jgi:hypothetical protein